MSAVGRRCRRQAPDGSPPSPARGVAGADIDPGRADLAELFTGADVVVHLAWKFQPTRDPVTAWRTNVLGSINVFLDSRPDPAGEPTPGHRDRSPKP
ncbi:hypothetical protein ACGFSI_19055 [Streptomyces virginiae]|uniref:hypothetical protein n=1 Tax=Streptomyces virginiae TaxID=1961 RepID=UPI003719605D